MIVYYLVKLSPCLNALYAAAMLVTNPLIFIKAGGHLRKWKPLCVRACGCVWMRVQAAAPMRISQACLLGSPAPPPTSDSPVGLSGSA